MKIIQKGDIIRFFRSGDVYIVEKVVLNIYSDTFDADLHLDPLVNTEKKEKVSDYSLSKRIINHQNIYHDYEKITVEILKERAEHVLKTLELINFK